MTKDTEDNLAKTHLVQDMITFNYYDYKKNRLQNDDIMDNMERKLQDIVMMKPNCTWNEIQV